MKDNPPNDDQGRGVIINIGSIQCSKGTPGATGYAGTKGCIQAMTLGLARDLAAHGIRVVTVEPGKYIIVYRRVYNNITILILSIVLNIYYNIINICQCDLQTFN
eukprot:GHVU01159608.1.p1 GENE.GHVU01159608.1~~GHVU01159608.1.p1  ORF type:complete len:105 (+),score=6.84 GHVU01159608.1:276-590(+)